MSFKSKEELLKEIQAAFQDLNNGTFDLDKMENLVENTRSLYERTVILRHKAHELLATQQHVTFVHDIEEKHEIPSETDVETVVTSENPESVGKDVHQVTLQDEIQAHKDEKPVFSVQDKDENFSFDFFQDEHHVEDEINENQIENHSNDAFDTFIDQDLNEENNPSPAERLSETPYSPAFHNTDNNVFSNYESVTNNPKSQMVASKIPLLSNSFSLNEKLVYIRELFDGSSNEFNEVVDKIDQLTSFDSAKSQLSEFAQKNHWDLNKQETVDFVNKVERRFL